MKTILLEFQFKDILNYVGGLIALGLFFVICYYIGQLGVKIKGGINLIKYINKAEADGKVKGQSLNEKGISLKQKGKRMIIFPVISIVLFYLLSFTFIPTIKWKFASLLLLIPVVLGYFGIFLIPEQLSDD